MIFTLVTVVVVYCAWRFRAKPGDDSDGPPIHGNTKLEITWTVVPAVLLAVMAVWAYLVLADNEALASDRLVVEVTAEQFAWEFVNREAGIASGDMRVPAGRQVELRDALEGRHPRLLRQGVPGQAGRRARASRRRLIFNPDRAGTYQVICSELCGVGHGVMRARVIVMEPGDYEAWVTRGEGRGRQPARAGASRRPAAAAAPTATRPDEPRRRRRDRVDEDHGHPRTHPHPARRPRPPHGPAPALLLVEARGRSGRSASILFAFGLVWLLRNAFGNTPTWEPQVYNTVAAAFGAIGFLIGIGCFDWWWRWITGRRVDYEDHSMHGAQSWRDYFKVNTDHKVIGVQYLVTVFAFFVIGGIFAELVRAELAEPGQSIGDGETYNGLFSVHATLMIFLFVIPAFAGLANFVLPIMIGAKDMAFPRLNALSIWMLIPGGLMIAVSPAFGVVLRPAGPPTRRSPPRAAPGRRSSRSASSSSAPARS